MKCGRGFVICFLGVQGKHALQISTNKQDYIKEMLHYVPYFSLLEKNPTDLNFSLVMVGGRDNTELYARLDWSHLKLLYFAITRLCMQCQNAVISWFLVLKFCIKSLFAILLTALFFHIFHFWFFSQRSGNVSLSRPFIFVIHCRYCASFLCASMYLLMWNQSWIYQHAVFILLKSNDEDF